MRIDRMPTLAEGGRRSSRPKPVPKRWLGIALSLLSTGLGHIYFGHTGRGLVWGAIPMAWTALVTIAMRPLGAALGYRGFLALLIVPLVVLWALAVLSVARMHPAMRRHVHLVQVVLIGLAMFLASRTLAYGLRTFAIEAFKIPSGSMIPT